MKAFSWILAGLVASAYAQDADIEEDDTWSEEGPHLIVTDDIVDHSSTGCLEFRGQYGPHSIWYKPSECSVTAESLFDDAHMFSMADDDYYWLVAQRMPLDPDIEDEVMKNVDDEEIDDPLVFQSGSGELGLGADDAEEDTAAADEEAGVEATDLSEDVSIYTFKKSAIKQLAHFFTPDIKLYLIPDHVVEPADKLPSDHPVSVALKNLALSPSIAFAIDALDVENFKKDVMYLSGESEDSPLKTRHSFTKDAIKAAKWLKMRFESYGAKCELQDFLLGFSPNVVCEYKGSSKPDEIVVLGAHYDSRGTFGRVRAPGADDDGSGTSMLLSVARAIHELGMSFERTVQIVAAAGEEQGLFGSRHTASKWKAEKKNVVLMIQGDMLAYRKPGESLQAAFPDSSQATEEATWLAANITNLYVPELVTGRTKACCSDHASWRNVGYAATQFFERNGPIADPMYHNSGDLSRREGYDFDQLLAISKAMFATILEMSKASLSVSAQATQHTEL